MDQNSEAILTQIFLLVQDLHQSLGEYGVRVANAEASIADINQKISRLIQDGFPLGNLLDHKTWHEQRQYGPIRRWILKLVT